jgi:hypothetical protein
MMIYRNSAIFLIILLSSVIGDETNGVGSFTVTKLEQNKSSSDTKVPPIATTATTSKTIFKPAVARTELRVSRNLNPDKVQTLNVRTNNGGVATIIVKKRDGKNSVNNEPRQTYYDPSNAYSRGEIRPGFFGGPVQVMNQQQIDEATSQHQFESGKLYRNWQQPLTLQRISRHPYDNYRFAPADDPKSVDLINSFMRHVETIESARRERSSIDGSIPNDRETVHTKIPEPVTINSETVFVKDQQKGSPKKRARSLIEIDTDGIPLVNGIRVPDDENDKRQTWRNARVINGELVPYENGYVPPRTIEYGQLIYPKKATDVGEERSSKKSIGPFTTSDNFSSEEKEEANKSIGPFSVTDMFTSRSKNEQGIGPFSVADNSRATNAKLIDYIKKINDHEYRKDYFVNGRVAKENVGGQQKIQRRMLTNPGQVYFPPSSKYSAEGFKSSDSSLSGPVLQYAHPEFGLQTVSNEETSAKNNKKIEYYTTSTTQQRPNQPNYQHQPQPIYQIEATGNAPPMLNTREYYNYHKTPATYPYNYGFIRRVKPERPFWMKISEQVRDTFQSGISQVHQIARPVMDPIMEAGEKISQNLGFTSPSQKSQVAQEKIYSPQAPTSGETTFIFPALGMIAGTAALGLGAVAMGRILDLTNMNLIGLRSSEESSNEIHARRALDAIHKAPTTTLFLVEDNGNTVDPDHNERSMNSQQNSNSNESSNTSTLTTSSSTSNNLSTKASPKAKFIELIAIPYQQNSSQDSTIEPSNISEQASLTSHQRRKRNK